MIKTVTGLLAGLPMLGRCLSVVLLAMATTLIAIASAPSGPASAQALTSVQQVARDIFKELIEINTASEAGDTGRAADAMAARLRAAGFAGEDLQVFKPAPRKGNLVARIRGAGAGKPILLLAHIDVVPAKPEDWSLDPFKFTEKDGYYYGRGTSDDNTMSATSLRAPASQFWGESARRVMPHSVMDL